MKHKVKKLKPWSTLSSKIVHKNKWYSVVHNKIISPKCNPGDYFVIHTKNKDRAAMIVPVIGDEIIFCRQYRYPTKRWCLELPAGANENDKSLLQTAIAELKEEAGYRGKLKKIGEYCPWSGPVAEITHVYLAKNLKYVGTKKEELEDLKEVRIKIKDAYKMLDDGKFTEGQTISALAFARKYLLK